MRNELIVVDVLAPAIPQFHHDAEQPALGTIAC